MGSSGCKFGPGTEHKDQSMFPKWYAERMGGYGLDRILLGCCCLGESGWGGGRISQGD